jgi:hypothetical protein
MRAVFRLRWSHAKEAPALARRLVGRALRRWGLFSRADDVLIAVNELVSNVNRHTGDGGDLQLALRPGAVLIEVRDASVELPRVCEPEVARGGGRGMRMVEAVARRWGTRLVPGGKVVWAEIPMAEIPVVRAGA